MYVVRVAQPSARKGPTKVAKGQPTKATKENIMPGVRVLAMLHEVRSDEPGQQGEKANIQPRGERKNASRASSKNKDGQSAPDRNAVFSDSLHTATESTPLIPSLVHFAIRCCFS